MTLYQIINYYATNPKNEKGSNADGVLRVSGSAYIGAPQSTVEPPSSTRLLPTANEDRDESSHITASATSSG